MYMYVIHEIELSMMNRTLTVTCGSSSLLVDYIYISSPHTDYEIEKIPRNPLWIPEMYSICVYM